MSTEPPPVDAAQAVPEHAIACRWCNAQPGSRCTTRRGRPLPILSHDTRLTDWANRPDQEDTPMPETTTPAEPAIAEDRSDDGPMPCGESGCICYGVGEEHNDHACGCDCDRCLDCGQRTENCDCDDADGQDW